MKQLKDVLAQINDTRSIKGPLVSNKPGMQDIQAYIEDNKIVAGPKAVPMTYIYALYCEQQRKPMSLVKFSTLFAKFFPRNKSSGWSFYRLEYEPFNLPPNYSFWSEKRAQKTWKYTTCSYIGVQCVPEGYMAYVLIEGKRKILGFFRWPSTAATAADMGALFYHGPDHEPINFKKSRRNFRIDDPSLKSIVTGSTNEVLKKENSEEKDKNKTNPVRLPDGY